MSCVWTWLKSRSVPAKESNVRRMGCVSVSVRTRESSGCVTVVSSLWPWSWSGHSFGVGFERFLWVLTNFSRACEDKWSLELGGLNLTAMILVFKFGGKDMDSKDGWRCDHWLSSSPLHKMYRTDKHTRSDLYQRISRVSV